MIHQPRDDRHKDAAAAVLDWYEKHGRSLPWRAPLGQRSDPYAVWLSEIMLQQTTVATVKGYFDAFISRWPTVEHLAAAPRDDVLAEWAGLGYYARARNLHAAAITVATEHHGKFPATEDALRQLPGVGAYTAAAVAAIAFGQRAVVVDGNIERVTSRWQAVKTPLPEAKPELKAVMDAMTPDHRAGDFAQAMMDIGAMICVPSRRSKSNAGMVGPDCDHCPLNPTCLGRLENPALLPIKKPKKAKPYRYGVVAVIRNEQGDVLMEQRQDRGLLGGMLVFPGSDWADGNPSRQDYPLCEDRPASIMLASADQRRDLNISVDHIFTHFHLVLSIKEASIKGEPVLPSNHHWVSLQQLDDLALPTAMRKVAKAAGLI